MPGHTSWVATFLDRSRRTVPTTGASLPSRRLVTAIYRPNGTGPFPLIVFSHGLDGHPQKFTKLFSAWADAGFAIAAPAFPLTNSRAANPNSNVGDVGQQPADVSFVLDRVLALNNQTRSRLFHAIDQHRIGGGGLSLGGLTTYMLVYGKCCRDQRIDAVAVLDGLRSDEPLDGHVPLLIAHSDTDPTLPYSSALEAFAAARAPAWFVTLHGAAHASQWEDDVTAFDHIPMAFRERAVQVVLGDHHGWGGLTAFRHLGVICKTLGWGLSQHSNSHLGISFAAMIHAGAAIPNLIYASDTHYPWNAASDVVRETDRFRFQDGKIEIWDAPGLGVTIDEDKLAAAHEAYERRGAAALARDDVGAMRERNPDWLPHMPKW